MIVRTTITAVELFLGTPLLELLRKSMMVVATTAAYYNDLNRVNLYYGR